MRVKTNATLHRLERARANAAGKVAHAGQVMTAARLAHAQALDELQLAQDRLTAALEEFTAHHKAVHDKKEES